MAGLFDDVLGTTQPGDAGLFDDVLAKPSKPKAGYFKSIGNVAEALFSGKVPVAAGLAGLVDTITPDIALGARGRGYEIASNVVQGIGNVAEPLGDKLSLALPEVLRGTGDQSDKVIRDERQLDPVFRLGDALGGIGAGYRYTPTATLADVKADPLSMATPTFIAEQAALSVPDMLASVISLPAYMLGRTNEIAERRVELDNRTGAPGLGDLAAAAPGAAVESLLERFATGRLGAGGVVRGIGLQTGTEVVEEGAANLAETLGTERGTLFPELGDAMLGGALAGGGIGVAAAGSKSALDFLTRAREAQAAPLVTPTAPAPLPPAAVPVASPGAQATVLPVPAAPLDPEAELDALLLRNVVDDTAAPALPPSAEVIPPVPPELAEIIAEAIQQPTPASPAPAVTDAPEPLPPPLAAEAPLRALAARSPKPPTVVEGKRQYVATDRKDKRGRPIMQPVLDYKRDGLLEWLGLQGGVDFEAVRAQGGADPSLLKDAAVTRPFGRIGWPALRKRDGLDLETLRERMQESGWLPQDDPNAPSATGVNEVLDLVMDAINGRPVFHPIEGDARLEAVGQQMREQEEARDDELAADLGYADRAAMYDAISAAEESRDERATTALDDYADARSLDELAEELADMGFGLQPADLARIMENAGPDPAQQAAALWRAVEERGGRDGTESTADGRDNQSSDSTRGSPEGAGGSARAASGPTARGLFADPSPREEVDAARRQRDATRDGRAATGRTDMASGDGELFAGPRPQQARVDDEGLDFAGGEPSLTDPIADSRAGGELDAIEFGLRDAIERVLGDQADRVEFLRGYEGLPANLRRGVEARNALGRKGVTSALYDPGTQRVFLFTHVVKSPDRAAWNALHEIAGHDGLRKLLGQKLDHALQLAGQNPTVKAVADQVAVQRKLRPDQRMLAIEEALADLAAAIGTGNFDRIQTDYGIAVPADMRASLASAVQGFLRRLKTLLDDLLGRHVFSDEDVRALLEAARQASRADSARGGVEESLEQVAFHGTPHTVDKFSLSKIGTGEGAQAFGWGLYFASNKEVAESYRKALTDPVDDAGFERLAIDLKERAAPVYASIKAATKGGSDLLIGRIASAVSNGKAPRILTAEQVAAVREAYPSGNLYTVEVPEDSDLLDWDKPLSGQPEGVRRAIDTIFAEAVTPVAGSVMGSSPPETFNGGDLRRLLMTAAREGRIVEPEQMPGLAEAISDGAYDKAASLLLLDYGIPGLRYLDGVSRDAGEGSHNYVVWNEAAISNLEGLDALDFTPEQSAALAKAGMQTQRRSVLTRVRESIVAEWTKVRAALSDSDAFKQAAFDKFHGLRAAEARMGGLAPEESPYLAARLTTGLPAIMESLLTFGAPKWDGGILSIDTDTKGLLDALEPVRGDVDAWLGWMVGRRAKLLKSQARENLFTDADIEALLSLGAGKEAAFKEAATGYLKVKNAVLDTAEGAGLLDPTQRAAWDHAEYLPFYRQDGDRTLGPGTRQGLAGQASGVKTLKGGTEALADPLANIMRNFTKLIDASVKNRAMLLAVDNLGTTLFEKAGREFEPATIPMDQVKRTLLEQGVAQAVIDGMPAGALTGVQRMFSLVPPRGEDVVRVMRDGKAEYYRVTDALVLRALTAFKEPTKTWAIKPFIFAKRLLTTGVTTTAEFVGANFIRDTASTWMIGGDRIRLGIDAASGAVRTLMKDKATREMMAAGGSFMGGQFYGNDNDATAAALRRALRSKGLKDRDIEGFVGTVARTPLMLWDKWMALSGAIENANRNAVYRAALRDGKPKALAIYEAKDLMDFSMQGDSAFMQLFSDVLPFFNARVQGMYKLGRAVADPKTRRTMATRGALLALASTALWAWNVAMYGDAYDEIEEWDKDTYWHIAPGTKWHVRIPKPFEIGLLFGTGPERIAQAITGRDRPGQSAEALLRSITGTLAINPIPQAVLPIVEQWANKKFFTGRPIENLGDEKLLPEAREEWFSSDTMKFVADVAGNASGLSAKRLEHLWNGYTGGLGGYALDSADWLMRRAQDAPERPKMSNADLPVLGRFLRGGSPPRSTRYVTEFYDLKSKADEVSGTIKEYLEAGKVAKAENLERENAWLLGKRIRSKRAKAGIMFANVRAMGKLSDRLGGTRREVEDTMVGDGSGAEKRAVLDEASTERNAELRKLVRQLREAERAQSARR